jgi:hypothetical protein
MVKPNAETQDKKVKIVDALFRNCTKLHTVGLPATIIQHALRQGKALPLAVHNVAALTLYDSILSVEEVKQLSARHFPCLASLHVEADLIELTEDDLDLEFRGPQIPAADKIWSFIQKIFWTKDDLSEMIRGTRRSLIDSSVFSSGNERKNRLLCTFQLGVPESIAKSGSSFSDASGKKIPLFQWVQQL